jgi:hypothetical protein
LRSAISCIEGGQTCAEPDALPRRIGQPRRKNRITGKSCEMGKSAAFRSQFNEFVGKGKSGHDL